LRTLVSGGVDISISGVIENGFVGSGPHDDPFLFPAADTVGTLTSRADRNAASSVFLGLYPFGS
jgi:hypothetical protein